MRIKMKIKHYCVFHEDTKSIEKILNDIEIPYSNDSFIKSFTIVDDDERFNEVKKLIDQGLVSIHPSTSEYLYSESEIALSKWFSIRSKHHWSYPQPESSYESITYNTDEYCDSCGQGLVQKDVFRMKTEPKWGRNNFLHLNWIDDELFLNTRILNDFKICEFTGIDIENVKLKSTEVILETVKQIRIKNNLIEGMTIENPQKELNCDKCSRTKSILGWGGIYKFKKETFANCNEDFYKSYETFGDGLMAARKIIVSKRVLDFIINKKSKEISFIPIQLI